jgi:hypothetical protein
MPRKMERIVGDKMNAIGGQDIFGFSVAPSRAVRGDESLDGVRGQRLSAHPTAPQWRLPARAQPRRADRADGECEDSSYIDFRFCSNRFSRGIATRPGPARATCAAASS